MISSKLSSYLENYLIKLTIASGKKCRVAFFSFAGLEVPARTSFSHLPRRNPFPRIAIRGASKSTADDCSTPIQCPREMADFNAM
jgi:hypothetical protein